LKLYEIEIRPRTPFGTALKGDTLFGHFCWQAAYDPKLLEGGLENQLCHYAQAPFVVFSSAFPKTGGKKPTYFFPRPGSAILAATILKDKSRKDRLLEAKALKDKKWMAVADLAGISLKNAIYLNDAEIKARLKEDVSDIGQPAREIQGSNELSARASLPHNSISRLSGTTGTGAFAPYIRESLFFYPGLKLALFVLLDEAATDIDRIREGLKRIGMWGFGKDASTGMGRFDVGPHMALELPNFEMGNACFTLAPSVPEQEAFSRIFFSPFIRFGKHGDLLATGKNPFKRPVIMADEGAVLVKGKNVIQMKPYIGQAVREVSYSNPETVAQGFTPWLPLKLEL
jgi:CRISPR-associated protein Csm4